MMNAPNGVMKKTIKVDKEKLIAILKLHLDNSIESLNYRARMNRTFLTYYYPVEMAHVIVLRQIIGDNRPVKVMPSQRKNITFCLTHMNDQYNLLADFDKVKRMEESGSLDLSQTM